MSENRSVNMTATEILEREKACIYPNLFGEYMDAVIDQMFTVLCRKDIGFAEIPGDEKVNTRNIEITEKGLSRFVAVVLKKKRKLQEMNIEPEQIILGPREQLYMRRLRYSSTIIHSNVPKREFKLLGMDVITSSKNGISFVLNDSQYLRFIKSRS